MNRGIDEFVSYYIDNKDIVSCNELGFGTDYSLRNKKENWKEWKSSVARHTNDNEKLLLSNINYLKEIITLCQMKNVKLLLVTTPTMPEYYNNIDSRQLDIMYKVIDDNVQNNDNVFYYDFLKDKRFIDDDFYDVDHLSDVGAEKLSRILVDVINVEKYY